MISVCIPVYNGESFLAETIESVLRQTFRDFELVILDNASTDGTGNIYQKYAQSDKRVRFIRHETNLGFGGNFNSALKAARFDLIKILCADDLIAPNCLQAEFDILADPKHKNIVMVTALKKLIDTSGNVFLKRRGFGGPSGVKAGDDVIRRIVRSGGNPINEPAAVIFRRDIALRTPGFDGNLPYVLDLKFWCELLKFGDLYYIDEVLCAFRVHPKAWSVKLGDKQISQTITFLNWCKDNWPKIVSHRDVRIGTVMVYLKTFLRKLVFMWKELGE